MKLNFGLGDVSLAEFGVGRDTEGGQEFVAIPVDAEVQTALAEMVQATWEALQKIEDGPAKYNRRRSTLAPSIFTCRSMMISPPRFVNCMNRHNCQSMLRRCRIQQACSATSRDWEMLKADVLRGCVARANSKEF